MATEKQIAYANDLIANIRAELARAVRFAESDHVDAAGSAESAYRYVEMMNVYLDDLNLTTHNNISGFISAAQKGVCGLAAFARTSPRVDKAVMTRLARYGLPVPPNFE